MSSVRISAAFPLPQLLSARPARIPALETNNRCDEVRLSKGGIMTTLLMAFVFVALLLAICHAASAACERELKRHDEDERPQHKKAA